MRNHSTPVPSDNVETRMLDEPGTTPMNAALPQEVKGTDNIAAAALLAEPPSNTGRLIAINTVIVGGAYVLSRVLGLVRETVLARQFGTTPQYDAYVAAFGIPDTLFLLIIGGAVGSAFIPIFTDLMRKGDERDGWRLASTLINISIVLLSLLGIVLGFAAPGLVAWLIYPGRPPEQQQLVVDLVRILLFSPLFMGLGGWAMGILNARQHFVLPALAPIAYNLAIIAGALFLAPVYGVQGVAWGVVAGALLHFGVQVPGLVRVGMRYSLQIRLRDKGVAQVGKLLLPRVLGQAAFQTNVIAMRSIGSFLAVGRIAAFNYAYLLMILPHGIFAMSLATVAFPTMAAQFSEGDLEGVRSTLARATKVLFFLVAPSAVGLFVLRYQIVATVFEYGRFGSGSTALVAGALGYFAMGLVAFALVELLTRGFYALHDTRTPVTVSVATVVINLGLGASLALLFGRNQGHEGLALSLAITTTLEMVFMWVLLGRRLPGWGLHADGILPSFLKSAAAAATMGIVLALALALSQRLLPPAAGAAAKLETAGLAVFGVLIGGLVYIAAALALRSDEVVAARALLLRRRNGR